MMKAFKIITAVLLLLMAGGLISAFTYNYFSKRVTYEYECNGWANPYSEEASKVSKVTIKTTRFGAFSYMGLWHKDAIVEFKGYAKDGEVIEYHGDISFEGMAAIEVGGIVFKNGKEVNFSLNIRNDGYYIREGLSKNPYEWKTILSGGCQVKHYWHALPHTKY